MSLLGTVQDEYHRAEASQFRCTVLREDGSSVPSMNRPSLETGFVLLFHREANNRGTELDLRAVIFDPSEEHWVFVALRNDFTGWGCLGDMVEVVVAPSWPVMLRWGLVEEDRRLWNLSIEDA